LILDIYYTSTVSGVLGVIKYKQSQKKEV
jgi:hypothetical protein